MEDNRYFRIPRKQKKRIKIFLKNNYGIKDITVICMLNNLKSLQNFHNPKYSIYLK